jgi:NADH oxidase (H2O-forming)
MPIYRLFAMISPLRDKGKLAGAFGSYGWSGEGSKILPAILQQLKLDVVEEGVFVKFTPTEEELVKAFHFGEDFAGKMKEKCT